MKRRDFIGAAAASIFAPKFGKWYQQGSGLLTPSRTIELVRTAAFVDYVDVALIDLTERLKRNIDAEFTAMLVGGR